MAGDILDFKSRMHRMNIVQEVVARSRHRWVLFALAELEEYARSNDLTEFAGAINSLIEDFDERLLDD